MKRASVALCAVVGLGLVSGCTPPDVPLVAVWTGKDGMPVAETRPCGGSHVTDVDLRSWSEREADGSESAADPAGTVDSDPDDSGWTASGLSVRGSASFALFAPPPSWQVESQGRQELLPGRTYALSFRGYGHGSDVYRAHAYFTADDLASLHPGQVWADSRAMSRDAFGRLVRDRC